MPIDIWCIWATCGLYIVVLALVVLAILLLLYCRRVKVIISVWLLCQFVFSVTDVSCECLLWQLNDVGFSRTADGELKYDLPTSDLSAQHIGTHSLLCFRLFYDYCLFFDVIAWFEFSALILLPVFRYRWAVKQWSRWRTEKIWVLNEVIDEKGLRKVVRARKGNEDTESDCAVRFSIKLHAKVVPSPCTFTCPGTSQNQSSITFQ